MNIKTVRRRMVSNDASMQEVAMSHKDRKLVFGSIKRALLPSHLRCKKL